jgi:hypothetical protein
MAARILADDQDRQLERIDEADAEKLSCRRLGHGQVAASIARRKMLSEWPCEVDASPPPGPGRFLPV